jgi:hypothetical protein
MTEDILRANRRLSGGYAPCSEGPGGCRRCPAGRSPGRVTRAAPSEVIGDTLTADDREGA